MRIRAILVAILCLSMIPPALISWRSYNSAVERAVAEAGERQLLIAKSLKSNLDRYRIDLSAALESITAAVDRGRRPSRLDKLMLRMNIRSIVFYDVKTGHPLARVAGPDQASSRLWPAERRDRLVALSNPLGTRYTGVEASPDESGNIIYAIHRINGTVGIAQIDTSFLSALTKDVRFGETGYAAVVDTGIRYLAHPDSALVAERMQPRRRALIGRLMSDKPGIVVYEKAASLEPKVVAIAHVNATGWNIYVAQSLKEASAGALIDLKDKLWALFGATGTALLLIVLLFRGLATPLERLADQFRKAARDREIGEAEAISSSFPIAEIETLNENYNLMARRVKTAQQSIERLAFTDSVTKLPNRECFLRLVEKHLEADGTGTLVFVDLDNFKDVNDLHGHDVGDDFLRAAADALQQATRAWHEERGGAAQFPTPTVARLGGDEFTVLVPGLAGKPEAMAFLERLRVSVAEPSNELGYLANASASIGGARFPADGTDAASLFRKADLAMYRAKAGGRDRAELFEPSMDTENPVRARRAVAKAIANDEMVLFYQPKLCARTRMPIGVEALVRWDHPEQGLLAPDLWLPAIRNTPLITELGEWVVERSLRDLARWDAVGHELSMAVNIGSRHFVAPGFVEMLGEAIRRHGLDSSRMELEVTEDALFASGDKPRAVLASLAKAGYAISIDDFGRGFSNLARLAQLPVHSLKIDRSIVEGGQRDPRIRTVLAAAISLARELGCKTVAEGVETVRQVDFVTHMGADILQGYYFAKPMRAEALMKWLKARDAARTQPMLEVA